MLDLRHLIFGSCRGECLSDNELHELYAGGNHEALTTAKLAHLVSCAKCLDVVNEMLGLPLLAERYRSDSTERQEPPDDANGGGASGGGPAELGRKLARRLRETHEHKPQELRMVGAGAGYIAPLGEQHAAIHIGPRQVGLEFQGTMVML